MEDLQASGSKQLYRAVSQISLRYNIADYFDLFACGYLDFSCFPRLFEL